MRAEQGSGRAEYALRHRDACGGLTVRSHRLGCTSVYQIMRREEGRACLGRGGVCITLTQLIVPVASVSYRTLNVLSSSEPTTEADASAFLHSATGVLSRSLTMAAAKQ